MEPGIIILIILLVLAAITGGAALGYWFYKTDKIRRVFKVAKGMTYVQVVAALGMPLTKSTEGGKLYCKWYKGVGAETYNISAVFINDIAQRIG